MKNLIDKDLIPSRQTYGSAGYDIAICEDITLVPGEIKTIDTGVVFYNEKVVTHGKITDPLDDDYKIYNDYFTQWVGLIFPRSSMGFKYGLRFENTICVIDQDFKDSIKLSITVSKKLKLTKGDRIAQIIFVPYGILVNEQQPTKERGGGIGSTGV